jgi:hypothetical protein
MDIPDARIKPVTSPLASTESAAGASQCQRSRGVLAGETSWLAYCSVAPRSFRCCAFFFHGQERLADGIPTDFELARHIDLHQVISGLVDPIENRRRSADWRRKPVVVDSLPQNPALSSEVCRRAVLQLTSSPELSLILSSTWPFTCCSRDRSVQWSDDKVNPRGAFYWGNCRATGGKVMVDCPLFCTF